MFRHFGPGLILMMTGVGTSHLVTAPVAGGRFEFALLWCIPIAYIFKYYGFEMAFRFTNATGKSLIEAYGTAWKKWPLWYVMITTIIQSAIGQAGRLTAVAAVAYFLFTTTFGWPFDAWVYGLVLGVVSVAVILRGNYAAVETATKLLAGLLVLSAFFVFLFRPAGLDAMTHFVIFETPEGSWLIIAAFLGLLPTGIDVSLQASEWGKAKKVGMGRLRPELERAGLAKSFDPFSSSKADLAVDTAVIPERGVEYCHRWFQISSGTFGSATSCRSSWRAFSCSWPPSGCIRARWRVTMSWGNRRDLHEQHRPVDDGRLHPGRVRRDLLHRVQLLRRLATRGRRLLP